MSKGGACFYCRHGQRSEGKGAWRYDCKLGIENAEMNGGVEQVQACKSGDPRIGFQIGGYYSHMWFEYNGTPPSEGGNPNQCLEWHIASDGEFCTPDGETGMRFHLCDISQIRRFIDFWELELEQRGWIAEEDEVKIAMQSSVRG